MDTSPTVLARARRVLRRPLDRSLHRPMGRALCAALSLAIAAPLALPVTGCDSRTPSLQLAPATSPEPVYPPLQALSGAPTGSVVSVPAVPPPSPGARIEDENNT